MKFLIFDLYFNPMRLMKYVEIFSYSIRFVCLSKVEMDDAPPTTTIEENKIEEEEEEQEESQVIYISRLCFLVK